MTVARAHHYVPVFYLAGFTDGGNSSSKFWVYDSHQDKSWHAKPTKVAHQRDFYRVEVDGVEPDVVEKELGRFECKVATVLRGISETRRLPEGLDFETLLGFLALQITRVPHFRDMYERTKAHITKSVARVILSCPELYEEARRELRRGGVEEPKNSSRESLLEWLEDEGRYTLEIPREISIQTMLDVYPHLIPVLAERKWILLIVKDIDDDFICSDRPVILVPTAASTSRFFGLGTRGTQVIAPLNQHMALLGHYGEESGVFPADRIRVADINQKVREHAHRFLYSVRDRFSALEQK